MVDHVALTGRKVLLAEDGFLHARELQQAVHGLGGTVLGPALSAAEAIDLLGRERPDLALLDVRPADGWVGWVIPALKAMRISFALLTAWDERHLVEGSSLRHAPRLEKPCTILDLQQLIGRLLGGRELSHPLGAGGLAEDRAPYEAEPAGRLPARGRRSGDPIPPGLRLLTQPLCAPSNFCP